MFRRNLLLNYLFSLPFKLKDGGSTFLRNIDTLLQEYTALHPEDKPDILHVKLCISIFGLFNEL
jgi:hypothetical protein